jgi:glycosyltransferase involved in cell wall biosynthesis
MKKNGGCKILYISYDGMCDPLGQSQVIPYLVGLSQRGHSITIVSTEKEHHFRLLEKKIGGLLAQEKIAWWPVRFSNRITGWSAIQNYRRLRAECMRLSRSGSFDLVHARSDVPALIGLELKKKYGTRLIFDLRGFWADERAEGGSWNLSNPAYRIVYHFFRKKEKQLLKKSDAVVSLTQKGKEEIIRREQGNVSPEKIVVIPCCTDLRFFSRESISAGQRIQWQQKLGLAPDDFVLSYSGSLGTWYLAEEMLQFFSLLLKRKPQSKFLFITTSPTEKLFLQAARSGIAESKMITVAAQRDEMPLLLSLASVSVFFIKNSYSKIASCPTKLGELMALGIPVISNAGVGDVKEMLEETGAGDCLTDFSEQEMNRVLDRLEELLAVSKEKIRHGAEQWFSLESGIEQYHHIYSLITSGDD